MLKTLQGNEKQKCNLRDQLKIIRATFYLLERLIANFLIFYLFDLCRLTDSNPFLQRVHASIGYRGQNLLEFLSRGGIHNPVTNTIEICPFWKKINLD